MGKGTDQSSGKTGAVGGASKSKEIEVESSGSAIREVEVIDVQENGFLVRPLGCEKIQKVVHYKQIGHEEWQKWKPSQGKPINHKGWIKEIPWLWFTPSPPAPKRYREELRWSMKYVDQSKQTDLDPANEKLDAEQSQYLASQYGNVSATSVKTVDIDVYRSRFAGCYILLGLRPPLTPI